MHRCLNQQAGQLFLETTDKCMNRLIPLAREFVNGNRIPPLTRLSVHVILLSYLNSLTNPHRIGDLQTLRVRQSHCTMKRISVFIA